MYTMTLAAGTVDPIAHALENQFGLADRVVDADSLDNSVARFRERGITLPTFAQLAEPGTFDPAVVGDSPKDGADPRNLWPEPYPRASEVDSIENDLNAKVCAGELSLDEAQRKESELKHRDG